MLDACRTALRAATTRLATLIRPLPDLEQPIPDSEWTAREAVAHLVIGLDLYSEIATGTPSPIDCSTPAEYAEFSRRRIADVAETDPAKLAYLLDDASDRFRSSVTGQPGDTVVTWHAGIELDLTTLAGLMVGEVVLHGYDIAVATRHPWPLVPEEVALILDTTSPVMGLTVDGDRTEGLTVAIGVELRGLASFVIRFDDGQFSVAQPGPDPLDSTLSADPTAFLLVTTGRMARWPAFALGLYEAGGSRPELAVGFKDLFVFP